jgi:KDO2-lipid IV(A) lauroyltransferase
MLSPASLSHPKYWSSWFVVGLLRLIGLLPFQIIYALSALLGELLYILVKSRRLITLTNLRICFPDISEGQRKRIARRHFRLLICSVLSIGPIWWGSKARVMRIVKVHGLEHLQAAHDAKQNVILLAPHFVALDAGGIALSVMQPLTSMYQTNKNALFDKLSIEQRGRFNIELFHRKAPLTSLIRQIRNAKPFYYLPDQNAGAKHGIFAPFFGHPASTFPALGKMASAGKAIVIPCSSEILPWGRGIKTSLHPLSKYPLGKALDDTTRMNLEIEKLVEQNIDNYLWSHKRFKRQPEGEPGVY